MVVKIKNSGFQRIFSSFVFVAFAQKQIKVLFKVLLITEKLRLLNYGATQTTLNYTFFFSFFLLHVKRKSSSFQIVRAKSR